MTTSGGRWPTRHEHKADDQATRDLIQKMLDCYALIGATNDYYSAAKTKMGRSAKARTNRRASAWNRL